MASGNISCEVREKVGSRDARKLRRQGRIPGTLQTDGEHAHVNLHFAEDDFLAARRAHVHLFDLDIGSDSEAALVRELQWDALGDRIAHVEFKRVVRGVETESEVELSFYGQVTSGILNHNVTHITIRCLPSIIPDSIEVNINGLAAGAHIKTGDLELPEGISLGMSEDFEIAVIAAPKAEVEETTDEDESVEPIIESEEKREKKAEDDGPSD
ncbi:MAG: 50S ribosomal protein L25 [bacterium]|nr:50S ribosomal protein L25 [bacterium]